VDLPWDLVLAGLGVMVPVGAALYEFLLVGRKRLGYRIQMDTIATDEVHSEHAGALRELRRDGRRLDHPSFVLLRVENTGTTVIDPDDYAVLPEDPIGIRVIFPERRVCGLALTEFSHSYLRYCFGRDSGLGMRDGIIELPKVPLNPGTHYKVLAALERAPDATGSPDDLPPPRVEGGVKGGVGSGGRIQETESNSTGISRRQAVALFCFVFLVSLAQLGVYLTREEPRTPLDCVAGELTLTGSTAFAPVLRDAADSYARACPGLAFSIDTQGSDAGLRALDQAGGTRNGEAVGDVLAFSDGPKNDGYPQLLARPVALSLYTLVAHPDTGIADLSADQIRRIQAGEFRSWSDPGLGGNDVPIRLVGREADSGTRDVFERVFEVGEAGENSDDCLATDADDVVRCRVDSTGEMLDVVAETPGALGYAELGATAARDDLVRVALDGRQAGVEAAEQGVYPFWETEYAYTYGEPPADSP
jgi:ABC-type phosphate transport system substrate-binding protein